MRIKDGVCNGSGDASDIDVHQPYTYFVFKDTSTNEWTVKNGATGSLANFIPQTSLAILLQNIHNGLLDPAYADIRIQDDAGAGATDGFQDFSNKLTITKSCIRLRGRGKELTILRSPTGYDHNNQMIHVKGTISTTINYTLSANSKAGTDTVTVTTGQAANFAIGDYVKIMSDETVEAPRKIGQINQVSEVNTSTGLITLDNLLWSDMTIALNAKIAKITTMPKNVSIEDMTITYADSSDVGVTSPKPAVHFEYTDRCHASNLYIYNSLSKGIAFSDSLNFKLLNSDFKDIVLHTSNRTAYGILIDRASRDGIISGCQGLGNYKHFITFDASGATNENGIPRNCTVSANTAISSLYVAFHTHESCENITFVGNTAIGGSTSLFSSSAGGFETRGRKINVVGNSVLRCIHRGIAVGGAGNANGTNIIGNVIDSTRLGTHGSGGYGIFVIKNAGSDINISGNLVFNSDGAGIYVDSGNDRPNITNNKCFNNGQVYSVNNGIRVNSCDHPNIVANYCYNNRGAGIRLTGSSTHSANVVANMTYGNAGNSPTGIQDASGNNDHRFVNNEGYNPIGVISTPFASSGSGDITNSSQGADVPESRTTWTVKLTPKTIIVTGGTISSLSVNGVSIGTGADRVFKLNIGETISITYSAAPTVTVRAE